MSEKMNNSGAIGTNDRKQKDTHPDYTGSAVIDGTEYWLNGWVKRRESDGESFLSLSFKEKDQQNGSREEQSEAKKLF